MAHFQLLSSHFQLGVFSAWCSELAVAKKKKKEKEKGVQAVPGLLLCSSNIWLYVKDQWQFKGKVGKSE